MTDLLDKLLDRELAHLKEIEELKARINALERSESLALKTVSGHANKIVGQRDYIAVQRAYIEELEQAIGYVMRAWHNDKPHPPMFWSIDQLKKAYPNWKDRYPQESE